jgi:N-acetylglucosamine kinase-like BadF-type ATPase
LNASSVRPGSVPRRSAGGGQAGPVAVSGQAQAGGGGGGYGLGRAALWWAVRAEDGRGPATALCEAVPAHFGVPEVADVAIAIHLGRLTEQDTRGLAPVPLAAAATPSAAAHRRQR